ncbi:Helicase associated domain protein [Pseudarthrobacter sp. NS4]|uniref:Helicase associated domain protein n=1 Tax=Pseudarthrobacter sp. NS4 TaxID=2973976 RepID=UPI0021622902|nr:Helicase associated domain protein [Pseudarthrobacter sp. NS4]
MPEYKRPAPHQEWVQLYRQGLTITKIAAAARVGESTVRYHLTLAAAKDPSLREDHRSAIMAAPTTRVTSDGLQNLEDTLDLYRTEGRLPSTKSPRARERALAMWLSRRRKDLDRGTLPRIYRNGLQEIPGWERRARKDDDEAQWNLRLIQLSRYIAAGNDWPRHEKTDTEEERLLGIWLHRQRIKFRKGKLPQHREIQLNKLLHGWRGGRLRGGAQGSPNIGKDGSTAKP